MIFVNSSSRGLLLCRGAVILHQRQPGQLYTVPMTTLNLRGQVHIMKRSQGLHPLPPHLPREQHLLRKRESINSKEKYIMALLLYQRAILPNGSHPMKRTSHLLLGALQSTALKRKAEKENIFSRFYIHSFIHFYRRQKLQKIYIMIIIIVGFLLLFPLQVNKKQTCSSINTHSIYTAKLFVSKAAFLKIKKLFLTIDIFFLCVRVCTIGKLDPLLHYSPNPPPKSPPPPISIAPPPPVLSIYVLELSIIVSPPPPFPPQ